MSALPSLSSLLKLPTRRSRIKTAITFSCKMTLVHAHTLLSIENLVLVVVLLLESNGLYYLCSEYENFTEQKKIFIHSAFKMKWKKR